MVWGWFWFGSEVVLHSHHDDSRCVSDPVQICGAQGVASVFQMLEHGRDALRTDFDKTGCHAGAQVESLFDVLEGTYGTHERCADAARAKGYRAFAMTQGDQCFGGSFGIRSDGTSKGVPVAVAVAVGAAIGNATTAAIGNATAAAVSLVPQRHASTARLLTLGIQSQGPSVMNSTEDMVMVHHRSGLCVRVPTS